MASRLTPCPACARHVKVGSASCPFCEGPVPVDVAAREVPSGVPISRALLVFGAAAAAVTGGACADPGAPSAFYGVFAPGYDAAEIVAHDSSSSCLCPPLVPSDGGTSDSSRAQSDGGTHQDGASDESRPDGSTSG